MKSLWRDTLSAVLAVLGGVVVFAKLMGYSWWLIGSWTGALGVLAVIALAILLTNIVEIVRLADGVSLLEFTLWLASASVIVPSLLVTTTKAEFVWATVMVGVSWLTQFTRDVWRTTHTTDTKHHYVGA